MYNINKRTWRLLLGLLVTMTLLYIVQRQTTTRFSKGATTAQVEIVNGAADKNAFVTFLCDDVMVIYPHYTVYIHLDNCLFREKLLRSLFIH